MNLEFKIATKDNEFEQIHRLNYKTFVEEIPQHPPNVEKSLVDKFHDQNTYIIGLDKSRVVGMITTRDQRPFSLDHKLENLDSYLPPHKALCEFRLLAIEEEYRKLRVFQGLLQLLARHCASLGYDLGIMSGTVMEESLYKHIGLKPFGPMVGMSPILFQPMYMTLQAYKDLKKVTRTFEAKSSLLDLR